MIRLLSFLFVYFTALCPLCSSWSPILVSPTSTQRSIPNTIHPPLTIVSLYATTRRHFASQSAAKLFVIASLIPFSFTSSSDVANAATTPEGNVFVDKNFSVEDAKQRFQAARKDLRYLIENYSDISKGGGDAVRNYLGTQGVNSNLYGIQKVLKILRDEASDIVQYTEAMDEFNAYYYQAEGAAYQSLFVEHSSAKGTPESFLKTAKQDLHQMEKYMNLVAAQLDN